MYLYQLLIVSIILHLANYSESLRCKVFASVNVNGKIENSVVNYQDCNTFYCIKVERDGSDGFGLDARGCDSQSLCKRNGKSKQKLSLYQILGTNAENLENIYNQKVAKMQNPPKFTAEQAYGALIEYDVTCCSKDYCTSLSNSSNSKTFLAVTVSMILFYIFLF